MPRTTGTPRPRSGPTRVVLPAFHAGQQALEHSRARFNVVACGRRFGKTTFAVRKVAETALAGYPAAWGGPTYKSVGETWRLLSDLLRPATSLRSEQEKRLELVTGGTIDVWSLEEADHVRGRGYKTFVVDEAAAISRLEYAWQQVIRPTLTDYLGDAWFPSTPKGRNYFWELFQLGRDPEEPEWASFRFPSSANPYLAPAELAAARRSLPARVFAQEYEADFVSDDVGVFRRVEEAARMPGATPQERALPGHAYVAGLDFGRFDDFTVLTVLDTSLEPVELVALDRFNRTDWQTQWTRIQALHQRFRPVAILAEKNAAGEPVIAVLRMLGLPVVEFVTSNPSKALAVQALALALEQEQLRLLDDPVLVGELLAFEAEKLPSGMIRYAAPENRNDDCVVSLCLAWLAATQTLTAPKRTPLAFGPARRTASLPDLLGAVAN
jgi:Terminase RNaseH-like domain